MDRHGQQDRYRDILMDHLRHAEYPHAALMDEVEATLATPEEEAEYLAHLLDRVEDDRFPTGHLLDRIERLGALTA